jgi:hypothetical protein
MVDVQLRGLGFVGNRQGPHLALQTGATVSFAY